MTNYGVSSSGSGDVTVSHSVVGQGNVVGDANTADPERIERLATEIRALLAAQAGRIDEVDEVRAALEEALAQLAACRPRTARALLDRVKHALAHVGALTAPVSELLAIAAALHGQG